MAKKTEATTEEVTPAMTSALSSYDERVIKGIKSQGMILLSENPDGSLYFVVPGSDAKNGSVVK